MTKTIIVSGLLLFTCAFLPMNAQEQTQVEFTEGLIANCVGNSTRSPIFTNNLMGMLVAGTLQRPANNQFVCPDSNGDSVIWKHIQADDDNWFQEDVAPWSWLYLTHTSAEETIMLLRTSGNSMSYFNGEPRGGDIYNFGTVIHPVKVTKGRNEIFVVGSRGRIKARLAEPESPIGFTDQDMTLPHVVVGKGKQQLGTEWGAVRIINATEAFQTDLIIRCDVAGTSVTTEAPALSPLITRKVGFKIPAVLAETKENQQARLILTDRTGRDYDTLTFDIEVVTPEEDRNETFISSIDGSVQYYAVSPAVLDAASDTATTPAFILTLHGASVEATGQARAYSPKNWTTVVAPTNRRPFGFDWEDWGRLDALEVLEIAQSRIDYDPDRVYLTGHSMGGHGTWQLGATFPDKWAAIAPSAGWYSFWSYGGKEEQEAPSPIEEIIERAANPSRTLSLSRNYKQHGVYIFHGDADATVPVEQARFMREHLSTFHTDYCYYEFPGGAHWFGQSVDWPPIFDYFKWHNLSTNNARETIEFHTACPGVSSKNSWVEILQQEQQMAFTSATITRDVEQRTITGTTQNAALIRLDITGFQNGESSDKKGESITIELDSVNSVEASIDPTQKTIVLKRTNGQWVQGSYPSPAEKNPTRYGMLKYGMQHNMIFVYGTTGSPQENAWAYQKARYDAETWWYRGNGSVDIVPDSLFNPAANPDRSVVLYGNATSSSAWEPLLGDSPVHVARGSIQVGEHSLHGDDLAICFVRPRPNSSVASVVVITGTGHEGMQTAISNRYFISGAGYPDLLIVSSAMLTSGTEGLRGAGFFGNDWSVENGEFQFW